VIPIYKAGDKSSVYNYRPISLLCILSEEIIVYNNIIRHVRDKITKHQFGFLPNCSALEQLLLFTEKLLKVKSEVDVVYMDFRKAFDSVSLNGLLNKLYSIGIRGRLWKWLQEYTCFIDFSVLELVIHYQQFITSSLVSPKGVY